MAALAFCPEFPRVPCAKQQNFEVQKSGSLPHRDAAALAHTLHGDPAQGVCHRADEDDDCKNGAQIPYHEVEHLLAAEGLTLAGDLLLDALHTDDAGHQQAGCNGGNGHHDRVGEEIEEVQELHPEHGHACQRAVAQRGQAAQCQHDDADHERSALTAPAQLVLKGGDGALGQGDGAGNCREQHQQKEQRAHHMAQAHALEHFGDGDEHQCGARLQGVRVAAGEGEHRRDDHQARHDRNGRVEHFHILGGLLNGDVLLHIGAEGDQDAHGDGQRVEHLAHGGDHGHPGKVCHIGHQKVLDAFQRTGAGDRVHRNDHRQHHQNGHHHLGDALHAVAHARKDDGQRSAREDDEAHLSRQAAGDETGEVAVLGQLAAVAADVIRQIADDPAADDRVVRHDQDGDDGVDPAAEPQARAFAKGPEGAHRAFLGHAAQGRFRRDHGVAKGDGQHDVHQQEDAAAVFCRQIRETPDVAQAHRRARRRQHEADLAGESTPVMLSCHKIPRSYPFFPIHK